MIKNSEKGVTLIMTFFVMIIVLTVVLSVSVLLYGQIKVVRNMGNSVASYYSAESGIEKVLFYDRRVLPSTDENARGLCYMLEQSNTRRCTGDFDPNNLTEKDSIYCNPPLLPASFTGGCAPDSCTDCTVKFSTTFDGRTYITTATISSANNNIFSIDSAGEFNSTSRKVNTTIVPNP